jgi:hypothetical protein
MGITVVSCIRIFFEERRLSLFELKSRGSMIASLMRRWKNSIHQNSRRETVVVTELVWPLLTMSLLIPSYSPDSKLHEVFNLYFTPFRVKIWSSHILLDILCNEELLINRAGVVKRLETCLSRSSAFNLFISFNHGTLKIINRKMLSRKE